MRIQECLLYIASKYLLSQTNNLLIRSCSSKLLILGSGRYFLQWVLAVVPGSKTGRERERERGGGRENMGRRGLKRF